MRQHFGVESVGDKQCWTERKDRKEFESRWNGAIWKQRSSVKSKSSTRIFEHSRRVTDRCHVFRSERRSRATMMYVHGIPLASHEATSTRLRHWRDVWQARTCTSSFTARASSLGHAESTSHDVSIEDDGQVAIFSPYRVDGFEFVAFWTCSWQEMIVAYFCKAYNWESFEDARAIITRVNMQLNRLAAEQPEGFH
jgi:hypothetical protein